MRQLKRHRENYAQGIPVHEHTCPACYFLYHVHLGQASASYECRTNIADLYYCPENDWIELRYACPMSFTRTTSRMTIEEAASGNPLFEGHLGYLEAVRRGLREAL